MVKELLSQDDPLLYGEAVMILMQRLLVPSDEHTIPVVTLASVFNLSASDTLDLALDAGFIDAKDEGREICAALRVEL